MSYTVKGFHSNSHTLCVKFIHNNELIYKEQGKIGSGMYFWDNLSNAYYWAQEKKDKRHVDKASIVYTDINIEKYLDLTDETQLDILLKLFKEYKDKLCTSGSDVDFDNYEFGKKIDSMYEFFDDFEEDFPIIKAIVRFKKPLHPILEGAYVISFDKIMYNVRKNDLLTNRHIVI